MIVPPISASALFCDDIREEISGALTIVGVMPDNLAVGQPPIMLSKLAIFVRVALAVAADRPVSDLSVKLNAPSGQAMISHIIGAELVDQTISEAREQGSALATFFTRLTASPFPIMELGRYEVVLDIGGDSYFAGSIKLVQEAPVGSEYTSNKAR